MIAPAEPLIEWPQPLLEYAGFVAAFLTSGSVGFRYAVLRPLMRASVEPTPEERRGLAAAAAEERPLLEAAAARAAALGLTGALLGGALLANRLPELAARRHLAVVQLVTGSAPVAVQVALTLVAIAGFALALGRRTPGWPIAAIGVIAGALRAAFFAQWTRLINPIHVLAGGLWIGTLFVLVVAGISPVLRSGLPPQRRGALVAHMVGGFSPLALAAAAVLALFGLITAWLHLKVLSSLWITPYGYALIAKLCVVLGVAALGAWNWRLHKPRLGDVGAALALRRSARAELLVAALVLAVTAILVSLPSPKPPLP